MKTHNNKKPNRGRIPSFASGSGDPFVEEEYARAVNSSLTRKENLIIEAPSGTVRRAAYLTTIIEHAKTDDKRVLVACATRALINELTQKILPEMQKALPCSFSFTEVGTREDYLCRNRLCKEQENGTLNIVDDYNDIYLHDGVVAWTHSTLSGRKAELPYQVPARIWKRISCPSNQCLGECCRFRENCYAESAYQELKQFDVVVCDYAFLYKTLKYASFPMTPSWKGHPLYGIDIAVLEEPIWAATLGREHSGYTIDVDKFRFATRHLTEIGEHSLWAKIVGEYDFFFRHLHTVRRSDQYSGSLTRPNMFPVLSVVQALRETRKKLWEAEYRFFSLPNRDCTHAAELDQAIRLCEEIEWKLDDVRTLRHPNIEINIEDDFRGFPSLKARPKDVSNITAPLFQHLDSVIIPSVTIKSSSIQQIKKVLGADPCRMVIIQSEEADAINSSILNPTGCDPQTISENGAKQ